MEAQKDCFQGQMAAQSCLHLTQYLLRQGVQVVHMIREGNADFTPPKRSSKCCMAWARWLPVYHFTLDAPY
ncbi:MAG: hypothetical protein R2911_17395 [Caldilineaceae bacterium]